MLSQRACGTCGGQIWVNYNSELIKRRYCSTPCRIVGMRSHSVLTRRRTDEEIYEKFLARVEPEPMSGCWLWTGPTYTNGYGQHSRNEPAHRYSWRRKHGPIPDGMFVDHKCRMPLCVNVDHLRVVTPRTNSLENSVSVPARNVKKTNCPRGHIYDRIRVDRRGRLSRGCRECDSITRKEKMQRRNAERCA